MAEIQVTVEPDHVSLTPGDSAEVTVSVQPTTGTGKVIFPVHSNGGHGKGVLDVASVLGAVFMDPRTEPGNLPVTIDLLRSDAVSATYRITASTPKLRRGERRRLRSG